MISDTDHNGNSKVQNDFTIVYASQTGQSKAIAESIHDLASLNGFKSNIFNINEHEKKFKLNEMKEPMVFVCSTTGDGEPPETALKCWSKLKRLDTEINRNYLSNLNYALLGLGDSNYTQFCNGPKLFHNRFKELGANCFFGPFWADDGVGLELEVEPFKDELWDALRDFFDKNKNFNNKNIQTRLEEIKLSDTNSVEHNSSSSSIQNENETPSINRFSYPILTDLKFSNIDLTLPLLVDKHLSYELLPSDDIFDFDNNNNNNNQLKGVVKSLKSFFSINELFEANVALNRKLTSQDSEKTCFNLKFSLSDVHGDKSDDKDNENLNFDYEPGHSISVICPNSSKEVLQLLKRLRVEKINDRLIVKSTNPSKKTGNEFVKLTQEFNLSVYSFFRHFVDIRSNSIKKALLRMLASYCTKETEEKRLLELSSKEGSEEFQKHLKENHLSLLDILNMFESCQPPIDYLIQLLPPLATRSYTLCSSPPIFHASNEQNHNGDIKHSINEMEIIFNLVKFDAKNGRTYEREGVATSYLSRLDKNEIFFFFKRKFQAFTFPCNEELSKKPLIMIGPGTGIAPFISFLRSISHKTTQLDSNLWFFYGCRNPTKDFLFRSELCSYSKLLKRFSVSFSRINNLDESYPNQNQQDLKDELIEFYVPNSKYVQDSIKFYSKEIINLICDLDSYIYVCGDALNMSKDVFNCFVECLVKSEKGFTNETAKKYLMDMKASKRYKEDIWA